jgi:hypothetical protein
VADSNLKVAETADKRSKRKRDSSIWDDDDEPENGKRRREGTAIPLHLLFFPILTTAA